MSDPLRGSLRNIFACVTISGAALRIRLGSVQGDIPMIRGFEHADKLTGGTWTLAEAIPVRASVVAAPERDRLRRLRRALRSIGRRVERGRVWRRQKLADCAIRRVPASVGEIPRRAVILAYEDSRQDVLAVIMDGRKEAYSL